MNVIKNYRDNKVLRASFNRLAEKTFGLNFEDWYQNGYWQEKYNPYSIVMDGEIVANVSVNIMDMLWNGEVKHLIQLGTVMTEERYRNLGLIREIMNAIDADYAEKVDGMYLWANDDVTGFYPKFGFQPSSEYGFSKTVCITKEATIKQIPMHTKREWESLRKAILSNQCLGRLDMVKNAELYLFYVTKFMRENVYYFADAEAYVIAEIEDGELLLHGIFAEQNVRTDDIIASFGKEIHKVKLGYAPESTSGYCCYELVEEDCHFFVKGKAFEDFSEQRILFPLLSHA